MKLIRCYALQDSRERQALSGRPISLSFPLVGPSTDTTHARQDLKEMLALSEPLGQLISLMINDKTLILTIHTSYGPSRECRTGWSSWGNR